MNNDQTENTGLSGNGQSLVLQLSEHKRGYSRKLYKAESDAHKAAELQKDIRTKTNFLYAAGEKRPVNFDDITDVKERTREYLEACAEVGAFPSMMGLAAYGYGVSRNHLYQQLKNGRNPDVARFLDRVRDLIADVLSSAALNRNADNVTAIFCLKNGLGFSDRVEIEPITTQREETTFSADDLMKRYQIEE